MIAFLEPGWTTGGFIGGLLGPATDSLSIVDEA